VVVAGRRVKTVDVHAHCTVPEALALMNLKLGAPGTALPPLLHMATQAPDRLRVMDEQGIDVEALSINPRWYRAERDVVTEVIRIQNERLAEFCAAYPEVSCEVVADDRLVDLVEEQFDAAIRINPGPDSSLVGRCFAKDRLVVVAAPSVPVPTRGKVRPVPAIVSSSFQPGTWTLDDGRLVLEPIPRLRLSSFLMIRDAALP
jgi:hypothetical protein